MEKVSPEPNSGCWLWAGGYHAARRAGKAQKVRKAYGKYTIGDKTLTAHRAAYILLVGEIPDGKIVCHHCDNEACVNPEHLFLGTNAENSADMKTKNRAYRAPLGEKAKVLSIKDVLDIKRRLERGEVQHRIAKRFGVAQTNISAIKLGKIWRAA